MAGITRTIAAKFPGRCRTCGGAIAVGEPCVWHRASDHGGRGSIYHTRPECAPWPVGDDTPEPPALPTASEMKPAGGEHALDALAEALLPKLEKLGIRNANDVEREREVLIVRADKTKPAVRVSTPHPLFERLLTIATSGNNAYVWGAPGAGKSHAAADVARSLNLPFRYVSLCPQSMPSLLMGYMSAGGTYVRTAFRETYERGGVFCIDEVDNANANLLASLNSALANGLAEFPDAQVEKHPDCIIIATGNTSGAGPTLVFPDRRPLDLAFRDRFVFLAWIYNPAHERKIARALAGDEYADAAESFTKWIQKTRAHCAAKYPALVCSPRAAYAAVTGERGPSLLARLPIDVVADLTLFQGIESGVKATILEACPLPSIAFGDHAETKATTAPADAPAGVSDETPWEQPTADEPMPEPPVETCGVASCQNSPWDTGKPYCATHTRSDGECCELTPNGEAFCATHSPAKPADAPSGLLIPTD